MTVPAKDDIQHWVTTWDAFGAPTGLPGPVYQLMVAYVEDELQSEAPDPQSEEPDWDNLDWTAAEAVIALSSRITPTRPYIEGAFKAALGLEWDTPPPQGSNITVHFDPSPEPAGPIIPNIDTQNCPETYAHFAHYWQRRRLYCPGVTK